MCRTQGDGFNAMESPRPQNLLDIEHLGFHRQRRSAQFSKVRLDTGDPIREDFVSQLL